MANTRLEIAVRIFVLSTQIGVISGAVMGSLFTPLWSLPFLVTGLLGVGLGLALGTINGLLLSLITCLCFYPLKQVQLYRATLKIVSATLAGSGVAAFGPVYFSSTSMTVSSAVLIGLSSVQASLVAGWSGALAAQSISQWYERVSVKKRSDFSGPGSYVKCYLI